MWKFIGRLVSFLAFLLIVITVGIFLPASPRASTAHLFAKIDKDSLLRNAVSPRIILIGGSNVSMSINSQLLKDSLRLYPINTGLSASIGLLYMLDSSLPHIRRGDVVIVCPEYSQFYDDLQIGTEDLVRVVLDNNPLELFHLRWLQLVNSLKYIPRYAFNKLKPTEYFQSPDTMEVYLRRSFNQYGDMSKHWGLDKKEFPPLDLADGHGLDESAIAHLEEFRSIVHQMGARLYLTFPALDEGSYRNQETAINLIAQKLTEHHFEILGDPRRYKMPERYMFDTPYHLTQPGVNYRTQLLIEDLKSTLWTRVANYASNPANERAD